MAYITQEQAAVYSTVIGDMASTTADAYLQIASDNVDAYCDRTFDTVSDPLPAGVAMAVALWAEELAKGNEASRTTTEMRIGDYSEKYATQGADAAYPAPPIVVMLLANHRILVVG